MGLSGQSSTQTCHANRKNVDWSVLLFGASVDRAACCCCRPCPCRWRCCGWFAFRWPVMSPNPVRVNFPEATCARGACDAAHTPASCPKPRQIRFAAPPPRRPFTVATVVLATRPSQQDESGGSDGDGPQDEEQDGQEHSFDVPAPSGGLATGLEGQADQEGAEESEEDEAPAADDWGVAAAESEGRAPLKTWEVAPGGRAASKKLERLGKKHGLELDDRLAELLRYFPLFARFFLFSLVVCEVFCLGLLHKCGGVRRPAAYKGGPPRATCQWWFCRHA